MSRFGWAFVNDVIIGTGSAGTGSAVDGPVHAVVVKDSGIISGATNFNFNNSTGFGQLTGSLAITNNLTVNGNLSSGPISATSAIITTNVSASTLTGTLRSNTGNKFGSAIGDIHQFTGSILAGIISGTTGQFTTISGSNLTGSTLLVGNSTISSSSIITISNNTITSSILYVTGATNTIISGRNLSGITFQATSSELNIGGPTVISTVSSMFFKLDGSKIFLYDYDDNQIVTYDLTGSWNIASLSNAQSVATDVPTSTKQKNTAFYFKPDGTKAYLLAGGDNNKLYQATLPVPWEVSNITWTPVAVNLTGSGGAFVTPSLKSHQGIHISEDGNYLFTCFDDGSSVGKIIRYTMQTPWDASSISHATYTSASYSTTTTITDVSITNDGKTLFVLESNGSTQYIKEFELRAPYDLTTLTLKTSKNVVGISGYTGVSQNCFYIKPDQSKIYTFTIISTVPKITQFNMDASEIDLVGHTNISGDALVSQNLQVYGDTTLQDVSASLGQFRTISGSFVTLTNLTSSLANITILTGSSISSSIAQYSQLTASFISSSIGISGNIAQFSKLTSSATLLTGVTTVGADIIPNNNNAYDLGSSANKWRAVYVNGSVTGDSLSATSLTASQFHYNGATSAQVLIATASNKIAPTTISGDISISNTGLTSINTGVIVNADINSSAAIAHSKLAAISSGRILMGNVGNVPTATAVSGDITIDNTGLTAIGSGVIVDGDINSSAAIAHSKLAAINAGSILMGNASNIATATVVSGDITIGNTGVTAIGSLKVTNAMLAGSIADSKLSTISTAGKVSNSATTATNTNTANAIVSRDASGNFTAGTITAQLTASSADINGGTIDGASIGATTQSTGKFTTLSASSTLNVGGNINCYGGTLFGNAASITGHVYGAGNIYSLTGDLTTTSGDITTTSGDIKTTSGGFIKGTLTSTTRGLGIKQEADGDTYGITIEAASTANNWDIYINSGTDLRFLYNNNTAYGGYLDSAVDVGAIDFTGQHRNLTNVNYSINANEHIGLIVVSCGQYKNSNMSEKPTINESLPLIKLSDSRNQKSVWGVVSDSEDPNSLSREYGIGMFVTVIPKQNQDDNRIIINSIGEGGMWVCNINGNLENGDYITTCEVPGYGMKQDDDLLHNYTVAKITQDCTFELNNPNYDCVEFQFSGSIYRKAFVGCTYHCG